MKNRKAWLGLAAVAVVAAACWGVAERFGLRLAHEGAWDREEEEGRPPVDGDYWAIRLAYGGDAKRMRFEPTWLVESAKQDRRIAAAKPAGTRTYAPASTNAVQLDPDAFTLLGPKPLVGEGFGNGNNAGRTNVVVSDPTDPTIAYLTSDAPAATPWVRSYRVDEALPFNLKRLRALLRARGVGRVTVKKRGSAIEPETLARQLRGPGARSAVVVVTRVAGAPTALVCGVAG